jgi:hypothetical protein
LPRVGDRMRIGVSGRRAGTIETLPRLAPRSRPHAPPRGHVVARHYGHHDVLVRRMLAIADLGGLVAALALVLLVFSSHVAQFLFALMALPAWIVIFKMYGLYDRDLKRISHMSVDDLPWIFHGVLVGCLLLIAYFKVTPPGGIDYGDLAAFGALAVVIVCSGVSACYWSGTARRSRSSHASSKRIRSTGSGRLAWSARRRRSPSARACRPSGT